MALLVKADMAYRNNQSVYGGFAMAILKGYRQMPLSPEAQSLFSMVTPGGLCTPKGVSEGVVDAAAYFQGVMRDVLGGSSTTCVWFA